MDEDAADELVVFDLRPASPATIVRVRLTPPTPLEKRDVADSSKPAVHTSRNSSELKRSLAMGLDLDIAGDNKIDVILVPYFHVADAPAPDEWS